MVVKLSLIVPVYNAEPFIHKSLNQLAAWENKVKHNVQIILVNDGSSDLTESILKKRLIEESGNFILISEKINHGKGYAVKKGMLAATGEFKIFTDADIPFGLEILDHMLHYLEFKDFDVCIGNRKSKKSNYFVKMNFIRELSSKLFTMVISRYVVTGVNDTQCGLKGFKAGVADILFSHVRTNGFAFDVELLYLSYKYEYDIKRIPVSFQGNNNSTINLGKDSIQMLWDIFRMPFRYHWNKKNNES